MRPDAGCLTAPVPHSLHEKNKKGFGRDWCSYTLSPVAGRPHVVSSQHCTLVHLYGMQLNKVVIWKLSVIWCLCWVWMALTFTASEEKILKRDRERLEKKMEEAAEIYTCICVHIAIYIYIHMHMHYNYNTNSRRLSPTKRLWNVRSTREGNKSDWIIPHLWPLLQPLFRLAILCPGGSLAGHWSFQGPNFGYAWV